MKALAIVLLSLLWRHAAAQDAGWNFTPLNGAIDLASANLMALQSSFENGTDPRLSAWFQSYKDAFYKTYRSKAAEKRAFKNFQANIKEIYDVNGDPTSSYWITGNYFSDLSYEYLSQRLLMTHILDFEGSLGRRLGAVPAEVTHEELAARRRLQGTTVDWRNTGFLSPVKDQGMCGSCWAYAATAIIEAAYNMANKLNQSQTMINLSEQMLISCVRGSNCGGGSSDKAIRFVWGQYQVDNSVLPERYQDGPCGYPNTTAPPLGQAVQLGGPTLYPVRTEAGLMQAVAQGPTVVYFQALGDFMGYAGGIYQPRFCTDNVNHAIVAVGYVYTGSPSSSYWIIRNSWGAYWGDHGYGYVQMTGTPTGPCGMYKVMFQVPLNFTLLLDPPKSPPPRPPSPSPSPPPSPRPPPRKVQPAPRRSPPKPPPPSASPPPPKPPPRASPPPPRRASPPPRRAPPPPRRAPPPPRRSSPAASPPTSRPSPPVPAPRPPTHPPPATYPPRALPQNNPPVYSTPKAAPPPAPTPITHPKGKAKR